MIILTELYSGDSNPTHFLISRMPNALIHCHHYCNDLEGADFIQENSVGCSRSWIRPTIRSKSIILTPNHAQILVWFTFAQNRTQIQGFYSRNDIFSDPNSKNSHFCHFFELFLSRPCQVYYSWSLINLGPKLRQGDISQNRYLEVQRAKQGQMSNSKARAMDTHTHQTRHAHRIFEISTQ